MEKMRLSELSAGIPLKSHKTDRPGNQQCKRRQDGLKKACADFESIFIDYMLKSMRSTIPQSGLTKGPGSDLYTSMLDRQVAQCLSAKSGGIGLQQMLLKQLDRQTTSESGI